MSNYNLKSKSAKLDHLVKTLLNMGFTRYRTAQCVISMKKGKTNVHINTDSNNVSAYNDDAMYDFVFTKIDFRTNVTDKVLTFLTKNILEGKI